MATKLVGLGCRTWLRRESSELVDAGYLLAEDVASLIEAAGQRYDLFHITVKEVQVADD